MISFERAGRRTIADPAHHTKRTAALDNLAHTLVGIALSRLRGLSRHPYATAALVIGANLPDCDVVMRWFLGTAGYLEFHRGITHAVLGLAAQAWLLGFVLHRLAVARLGDAAPPFASLAGAWLPAAVGLASHFVLDYAISYGIRPWLPFSGRWVYGDFVFVVDPWLWLVFGALAIRRTGSRASNIFLAVSGLFAALITLLSPVHELAATVRIGVPVGIALIGFIAGSPRRREWVPALTGVALLALVGYVAAIGYGRKVASDHAAAWLETPQAQALEVRPAEGRGLLPMPGDPFSWAFIVAAKEKWVRVAVHSFRGVGEIAESPRALPSHDLERAEQTRSGRAWREFARFPTQVRAESSGRLVLVLSDARYWYTDFCTVEVRLDK